MHFVLFFNSLFKIICTIIDIDQSNWQKAESLWQVYPTPHLYPPGGSIGLMVWLQFAIASLVWGQTDYRWTDHSMGNM